MMPIFFFKTSVYHRNLHSFPTRRSSDLATCTDLMMLIQQVPQPVVARVHGLDRKSTRLNSSHVEISYAVFCLKKKKPAEIYSVNLATGEAAELSFENKDILDQLRMGEIE